MEGSHPDPRGVPLALYVHVPWCESKCPYCDFNSHALKTLLPEEQYIDALLHDLELDLTDNAGALGTRQIESIFFGGGTPSLLSGKAISRLLDRIRQRVACSDDLEVSLEANPGSSDSSKFKEYRKAGVTRLSLGVQSLNSDHLRGLGRIHSPDQAQSAIQAAKDAGFKNLNIDLMFGLHNQTIAEAILDVKQSIKYGPAHISCYQLTIEPNTWFYHHPPELPDDELLWDMQESIAQELERAGYKRYEVSAFARDDFTCKHNLNYWRFGDYLGIGAGAHGKITGPGGIARTWKVKHPRFYLAKADTSQRIGGKTAIADKEIILEFMLNALRLRERIDASLFYARTGLQLGSLESELRAAQQEGLLDWDDTGLRASEHGYRYLNDLLDRFVPDLFTDSRVMHG